MAIQKNLFVFTDGGARGNPGPAAIGVVIKDEEKTLTEIGKRIGENTNNFAEYSAVLEALDWILENKESLKDVTRINFYMDSELAYSQLSGIYKIKNQILKDLNFKIRERQNIIKIPIFFNHVLREKNRRADKLVNLTLDNKL